MAAPAGVHFAAWLLVLNIGISIVSTDAGDPRYPVLRFDTRSENLPSTYRELIRGIRIMLQNTESGPVHGIPRLHDPLNTTAPLMFMLDLVNNQGEIITLAIDSTRLNMLGYRRMNQYYYFVDAGEDETLFGELQNIPLPFGSTYGSLQRDARLNRKDISLGRGALDQSISDLHQFRREGLASSFIVVIQMFSEAIRFSYIEHLIRDLFESNREEVPSSTMIDLENNWDSFSIGIQKSIDGVISPPIIVTNSYGNQSVLDHVFGSRIALNVGILYFMCNNPRLNYGNQQVSSQPTGRRRNVEADSCVITQEPTVRISGGNGLCAQVSDDGSNAIVLGTCESDIDDLSLLWTLKADGTIRYSGDALCLTAYGYDPGDYIMIYECETAAPDATKWEIWDNGTIFNSRASLVVGAYAPDINTTLMMMQNEYTPGDAWVFTNNTQPFVTPIMNEELSNMCIQVSDDETNMGISGCSGEERRQLFALYPDGSIRPNDLRHYCLTADVNENVVYATICHDLAEQRWFFNTDYTITNLNNHLAMVAVNNDSIYLIPSSVPLPSREWRLHFV